MARQLGKQPQPIKTKLIKIQHVFATERSGRVAISQAIKHSTVKDHSDAIKNIVTHFAY